jgi:hypothetical protein
MHIVIASFNDVSLLLLDCALGKINQAVFVSLRIWPQTIRGAFVLKPLNNVGEI